MVEYHAAIKALRGVATLFKHGEYNTIPEVAGVREHEDCSGRADMDTTGGVRQQTTDSEVMTEALEVVQDIPSSQMDAVSESVASASSVESTQVCADQLDSVGNETDTGGAPSGIGGDELVSVDIETGTSGDQLVSVDIETGTSGDQLEAGPTENVTEADEHGDHRSTLALANLTEDFQIMSPPKAKGRPKQKPRAVKAKRNQAIAMIQEDMAMHERQMSLLTVYELLDGEPSYRLTHEKLLQFKEFIFANKPKPPIAHEIAKLPLTLPLMRPEDIVRIFPMQLINKCTAKVTAYQAKKWGTLEMQIALEIVGVGVFANSTIALMRKWYTAVKVAKKVKRALAWIAQVDFMRYGNTSFYVEEDPAVLRRLECLPILSTDYADMIDLAAKETLSAQVMQMILHKLFGADPHVRVIDPSNLGISNGAITTESEHFKRALAGATKEMKVLFPINCNNNHWCGVMMDLVKGRVYVYDSMASSYIASVRVVAQQTITMVPEDVRPSFRLVNHNPGLGVQTDSYNCGVYVLLAFEMFCGSEPLGHLDKKTLQCMRYRYLHLCLQDEVE